MKYKVGDILEFHGRHYGYKEYCCYLGYGVHNETLDVELPFIAEIIEILTFGKQSEYKLKILDSNIVFADFVSTVEKYATKIESKQLELQF